MLSGKKILAVVPARSGSKGLPNKNMMQLSGASLIAHAGICLSELDWVDCKIISTDSEDYIKEGGKYGLESLFVRPPELSGDTSSALDTLSHAIVEAEKKKGEIFDVILLLEPTSPMRQPKDILDCVECLLEVNADSVVTVSHLDTKYHPDKVLKIGANNKLGFYTEKGHSIIARQQLDDLYWRNGICYAFKREIILEDKKLFSRKTYPLVIERDIVNIDEKFDFELAELLNRHLDDEKD